MLGNLKTVKTITISCILLLIAVIVSACSPNILNIAAIATQGTCVQASAYGPLESQAIAGFPIISKNPTTAPYCASITIQNNNAVGQGGTSMQVTSPGLIITGLPNESSIPFSMIDPVAAQITLNTANQTQVTGDIALFDPHNCVTTTGVNTITLQSGQTCQFYLQIVGESYPPNTYPLTVAYNYYNGNTTYVLFTTINQRVGLYAGTESGLFTASTSGTPTPAQWSSNGFNAPNTTITSLLADDFGNIYFAATNQVFLYNGISLLQLGHDFATAVTSLTMDVNNNLYAGTNGSGIYIYNTTTSPNSWVNFTDTNANLTASSLIQGLSSTGFIPGATTAQNFYATTESQAFKCSIMPSSTFATSCAFSNISNISGAPSSLNPNSIDSDDFGNLYVGSNANAYSFIESTNSWQNLSFSNVNITGSIAGIYYSQESYTYWGVINATNSESATVLSCGPNTTSCFPYYISSSHTITGNAYAITADGQGDVFVGGNMLNSLDFTNQATNATGAYLYVLGSNVWQPINNGSMGESSTVNSMVISSSLTVY